jgi:Niemann-Pick C1 protein
MAVCFVCMKDNDRKAMTKESIAQMGPPVFNGGFSTFLAFLLLAWSESYVFSTFFKVW